MKKANKIMLQHDKIKNNFSAALFLCALILFSSACEPAPSMKSNNATPLPTAENQEKLTSLQREIRDMETADFKIIFVFKRKDGGVFDKEDKKYLAANKPVDVNRFILTDDEKAYVAGTNFDFPTENMETMKKRFIVEDYSKPSAPANSNTMPEQKR